jgi:excisionase family DNA binding protein
VIDPDLSLHEVAAMLQVHYYTVYGYVRQGQLPGLKKGRSWWVKRSAVEEFVSRKAVPPAACVGADAVAAGGGRRGSAEWAERLEARLIEGDEAGARKVLESALGSGHDLMRLFLDVLSPAMAGIGARWRAGELDIYVEHRASNLCVSLMNQIGSRFVRRGVPKGEVLMGAPTGEQHGLPVTMAAILVRSEGWAVHDLGVGIPPADFASAARRCGDLVAVCLGVTMPAVLPAARETTTVVRGAVRQGTPVFVGGAAVTGADQARDLGADHWTSGLPQLIELLHVHARRRPHPET